MQRGGLMLDIGKNADPCELNGTFKGTASDWGVGEREPRQICSGPVRAQSSVLGPGYAQEDPLQSGLCTTHVSNSN